MHKDKTKKIKELEVRVLELEEVVEKCSRAFDLVPIWALEREQTWLPSEDAIRLLKKAKDEVRDYSQSRYHGERKD